MSFYIWMWLPHCIAQYVTLRRIAVSNAVGFFVNMNNWKIGFFIDMYK